MDDFSYAADTVAFMVFGYIHHHTIFDKEVPPAPNRVTVLYAEDLAPSRWLSSVNQTKDKKELLIPPETKKLFL